MEEARDAHLEVAEEIVGHDSALEGSIDPVPHDTHCE